MHLNLISFITLHVKIYRNLKDLRVFNKISSQINSNPLLNVNLTGMRLILKKKQGLHFKVVPLDFTNINSNCFAKVVAW